jgi:hypothetical protein
VQITRQLLQRLLLGRGQWCQVSPASRSIRLLHLPNGGQRVIPALLQGTGD